jgi:hypothetical protein
MLFDINEPQILRRIVKKADLIFEDDNPETTQENEGGSSHVVNLSSI